MKKKQKFFPTIWSNVYEDDISLDAAAIAAAADAKVAADAKAAADAKTVADAKAAGDVKAFSQQDVDRIVQSRLRKQEEAQKNLVGEINALKAKSDLTQEERTDWETRLEQLNNTLLSEQQLSEKEAKRRSDENTSVLTAKDQEIDKWKGMFTSSTVMRSLTDAAVEHKAFHPEQIVSMLDRKTRLVEELVDGKPTGNLVPLVRFESIDEKGKPAMLDISPSEAVKLMTEIGKYGNLFEGKGTGGIGTRSHAEGGKKQDLAAQTKDIGAYLKGRRDGTITLD